MRLSASLHYDEVRRPRLVLGVVVDIESLSKPPKLATWRVSPVPAHGGTIVADPNEAQGGTTFRVTLPRAPCLEQVRVKP